MSGDWQDEFVIDLPKPALRAHSRIPQVPLLESADPYKLAATHAGGVLHRFGRVLIARKGDLRAVVGCVEEESILLRSADGEHRVLSLRRLLAKWLGALGLYGGTDERKSRKAP